MNWRIIYQWLSKDSNEKLVSEYNLTVDWIGRMYTIINFPENNPTMDVVYARMKIEISEKYDKMRKKFNMDLFTQYDYKQISLTQYLFVISPDINLVFKNLSILSILFGVVGTTFGVILGIGALTWFSFIIFPPILFALALAYIII